jgi:hypothetical protein
VIPAAAFRYTLDKSIGYELSVHRRGYADENVIAEWGSIPNEKDYRKVESGNPLPAEGKQKRPSRHFNLLIYSKLRSKGRQKSDQISNLNILLIELLKEKDLSRVCTIIVTPPANGGGKFHSKDNMGRIIAEEMTPVISVRSSISDQQFLSELKGGVDAIIDGIGNEVIGTFESRWSRERR